MTAKRALSGIKVGQRFRTDLGDLDELAASIESVGLLHPIVILKDGTLVAGARRLGACRVLGWSEIPVTVADNLDDARRLLVAERDENTCRLDMKPSERVALGRELEKLERPKAKERELAGVPSETFTEGIKGQTRDLVGSAVGWSGVTYNRAKRVVEAAETGDPEAVEAMEKMDESGKVATSYRKVMRSGFETHFPDNSYHIKTERHRQLADTAHRRLAVAISTIEGHRLGLEKLELNRALAVANASDVSGWVETLSGIVRDLGRLMRQLKEAGGAP